MQPISVIAVFSVLMPLAAADVVILKNGDRLTGTVQKLENGYLSFKSEYSDRALHIDWKSVTGLHTEKEIKAKADGGETTGKFTVSDKEFAFLSAGKASIAPSSIVSFEAVAAAEAESETGWLGRAWENTSLSLEFGQSYSGSNRYNQFSSNTELTYQGSRWDGTFVGHLDYYGGTKTDRSTYQAYGRVLAQRYIHGDHFFLFPYGFLGRQTSSDEAQGQIRQFGGGAGWTFRRHKDDQVSFHWGVVRSIGTGFANTEQGRVDGRYNDTLFVTAATWDKTHRHKITSTVKMFYFKPLNVSGRHSVAIDASTKVPFFGPVYFTVHAYDTPEMGQRTFLSVKNLQVSSGIGIEF